MTNKSAKNKMGRNPFVKPKAKTPLSKNPIHLENKPISKSALLVEKVLVDVPATAIFLGIQAYGIARAVYSEYRKKHPTRSNLRRPS